MLWRRCGGDGEIRGRFCEGDEGDEETIKLLQEEVNIDTSKF